MSRKVIKTVSNEPEEFICTEHKDLDKTAEKVEDRPIIFIGKRTTRDQQWLIQDMLELKDADSPDKGVKGMGVAFKYMWETIILEVKNVQKVGDSFTGAEKDALWDSSGMDSEITEAITHFYTKSSLTEEESKTSDSVQDSTTS